MPPLPPHHNNKHGNGHGHPASPEKNMNDDDNRRSSDLNRARTYSNGSTRGAFYDNATTTTTTPLGDHIHGHHRRKPKRHHHHHHHHGGEKLSIPTGGDDDDNHKHRGQHGHHNHNHNHHQHHGHNHSHNHHNNHNNHNNHHNKIHNNNDTLGDAAAQAIASLGGMQDIVVNTRGDGTNNIYNGAGATTLSEEGLKRLSMIREASGLTSPRGSGRFETAGSPDYNQNIHHPTPLVTTSRNVAVTWLQGSAEQQTQQGQRDSGNQQQEIMQFSSLVQANYGAMNGASPRVAVPPTPPAPAADRVQQQQQKHRNHHHHHPQQQQQQQQQQPQPPPPPQQQQQTKVYQSTSTEYSSDEDRHHHDEDEDGDIHDSLFLSGHVMEALDPTHWLSAGVKFEDGTPYFEESAKYSIAGFVRHFFYNPISPEFTSLQQFCWAVLLGVFMGFFTATWKTIIEFCVDFMWETVPEFLLEIGFFTELDGSFPLYHYMWICPAVFGGVLSYICVILPTPLPGQNEWINAVHSQGVQDHTTFFQLIIITTAGMASGLSLGPELPLVLTSGMVGSWLGLLCKQSMLQARVMNLTAASAAIGGFFGFPMAGALFVLEIPHRMGLQYFEALSPATIASIVAVLSNRLITGNDVTGYYQYPFLTSSLPSEIFTSAIVYGLFGAFIGIFYARGVMQLKHWVHDLFHKPHDDDHHGDPTEPTKEHDTDDPTAKPSEKVPLVPGNTTTTESNTTVTTTASHQELEQEKQLGCGQRITRALKKFFCCVIPHEPTRAAVAGTIAGIIVGVTCMFIPHVTFWGEAQLQTLIDKGRTPLPVFGYGDEPTADLLAMGHCLIDTDDPEAVNAGFSIACSALITIAKVFVTGVSLGTGIIGGHFWGPLFTGCIASHFFTDLITLIAGRVGFGETLYAYPCVAILCVMGSTHVVTFRAHMAIMLILTLTISAFNPEDGSMGEVAGDYSAIFPLLVVAVFVSLMVSRTTVFYKEQRSRGDIMALPEVLCEPGKEGRPVVMDYGGDDDHSSDMYSTDGYSTDLEGISNHSPEKKNTEIREIHEVITQQEIEQAFQATTESNKKKKFLDDNSNNKGSHPPSPKPPRPTHARQLSDPIAPEENKSSSVTAEENSSARLDFLLSQPIEQKPTISNNNKLVKGHRHRRTRSAPVVETSGKGGKMSSGGGGSGRGTPPMGGASTATGSIDPKDLLVRVNSFGQISNQHPSLMDQARLRSASSVISERRSHRRVPSLPTGRHSRKNSDSSVYSLTKDLAPVGVQGAALTANDIERSFHSVMNQQLHGVSTTTAKTTTTTTTNSTYGNNHNNGYATNNGQGNWGR